MKLKITLTLVCLALAGAAALSARRAARPSVAAAEDKQATAGTKAPILIELFTSEGCSSCPPADELLMQLEQSQPVPGAQIIVLSEHVDYWNHLGWKDPYSSAEFSTRQNDYAKIFNTDEVYTPQMVVDGHTEFVGNNSGKAHEVIEESARDPKANVVVTLESEDKNAASVTLAIRVEGLQGILKRNSADVLLAITESGLRSSVSSGENAGRRLTHTAVVRKFSRIGSLDAQKNDVFSTQTLVRIEKAWKRENLKAVVFVQDHTNRRVLGVTALALGK